MTHRRVKNIIFNEDDYGDDFEYSDEDDHDYSTLKLVNKKPTAAAAKPKAGAAAKPKAGPAAKPKAGAVRVPNAKIKSGQKFVKESTTNTVEKCNNLSNQDSTKTPAAEKSDSGSSSVKKTDFTAVGSQLAGKADIFTDNVVVQKDDNSEGESDNFLGGGPKCVEQYNKCVDVNRGEAISGACEEGGEANDEILPSLSVVIVGHVDAGKSTLVGHLLYRMGALPDIKRFQKGTKGKAATPIVYAWVTDEGEDERKHGVTIDVCVKHIMTPKMRRITILDAPGHKDFVPNMLAAAVQADVSVLVVDVDQFYSGFERGGQTKEHVQVVRSLGIANLIVAVNKMDSVNWSEDAYNEVVYQLHEWLTGSEAGFNSKNVIYVPLSAFQGVNVTDNTQPELMEWAPQMTLLDAFDLLPISDRIPFLESHLSAVVADVSEECKNSVIASVKIVSGELKVRDKILLLPGHTVGVCKGLWARGIFRTKCFAGEYVDRVRLHLDSNLVTAGSVICSPSEPLPVVRSFWAKIAVFDVNIPIVRGQQVMAYVHVGVHTASIGRIAGIVDKKTGVLTRTRALTRGNICIVEVVLQNRACVEFKVEGRAAGPLSRVILRDQGQTIAAGLIVEYQPAPKS